MDNSSGRYQIWWAPTALSKLVSVGEDDEVLPASVRLHQNFPNPFNPRCEIEYELPNAGFAILTVFDVYGREVATLVRGQQSAGTHRVTFDAQSGSLASGVYLYRLSAGNAVVTRKMVLLK
jgi:hypothetical protein